MKTKLFSLFVVAVGIAALLNAASAQKGKGLVVHEWGTFTSLQGGDGKLISWKPLQTSELPKFVDNWNKPDLGLRPNGMILAGGGKGSLLTLQRMETPVIYFYSDKTMNVDASVKFPEGLITEWFPRASQIGPAYALTNHVANPNLDAAPSHESLVIWSNLTLMPIRPTAYELDSSLPMDNSGSHYYAARNTDSSYVMSRTQPEKFLFYRGVGNFKTPLRVSMNDDKSVTFANTGKEPLTHLYLLTVKDKKGAWYPVPELKPGKEETVSLGSILSYPVPLPNLSKRLGQQLAKSLVASGLYEREAGAMVDTWKDSWFAEDGLRVLYVLPRGWTDQTLPMEIKPAPQEIVRVMVGRAEILPPNLEHALAADVSKVKEGDSAALNEVRKTLRSLGRFAEPAMTRAMNSAKPPVSEQPRLWALLREAAKPD